MPLLITTNIKVNNYFARKAEWASEKQPTEHFSPCPAQDPTRDIRHTQSATDASSDMHDTLELSNCQL